MTTQLFEGPQLEPLLGRIHEEAGPEARIIKVDKVRDGGIGGFFQRERFEVAVDVPERCAPTEPDEAPVAEAPTSVDDLARLVDEQEAERHRRTSTATRAFADVMQRVVDDLGADDGDEEPWGHGAVRLPGTALAERGASPLPRVLDSMIRGELLRLGLPESLIPVDDGMGGGDRCRLLARSLENLPKAPALPRQGGDVVAVIGDPSDAMAVGTRVARVVAPDRDGVVLASDGHPVGVPAWMHLRDPESVAARRRSWRRRSVPIVVGVAAPVSPNTTSWPRSILEALEPTLVIGVVDARQKNEDLAEWVNQVGGVDALALENTRATVSPASVLHLNIPLLWVDGKVASPTRWATLLVSRMAGSAASAVRSSAS